MHEDEAGEEYASDIICLRMMVAGRLYTCSCSPQARACPSSRA